MRKAIALLLALAAANTAAAAEPAVDQVLQGFDDDAPAADGGMEGVLSGFDQAAPTTAAAPATEAPRTLRLGGALALSAAYNYAHAAPPPGGADFRGLSRARTRLDLELDAEPADKWRLHLTGDAFHDFAYQWRGRDDYTPELRDSLEDEAQLGEAWLQGKLARSVDLKIGRQIVVWGKSDNLRVTDILNPLDTRELGLTDIEDLRLPVTMSRLDWYGGNWDLTALAIHEVRFDERPAFGSDFYPYPTPLPPEPTPADGGADTGYALALNGIFSGWDLAFYGASLLDDRPHLEAGVLRHNRIGMAGSAVNLASGNWLWKGEAAHFTHLRYSTLPGAEKSRSDLLFGTEYSGLRDTTLSLEVVGRHLHDWQAPLAAEGVVEDDVQWALRYTGDFLHARLKLTALNVQSGSHFERGGFTRLQGAYEVADATILTLGLVSYKSGAAMPFNAIGDNDRLFAELKYSF